MSDDSRPFGIFRAVVHLALGSVLLGIDQLQEIARESEPLFDSLDENEVEIESVTLPVTGDLSVSVDSVAENERLRYALIGMVVRSSEGLYHTAKRIIQSAVSIGVELDEKMSPFTGSKLFRPIRNRYGAFRRQSEAVVEKWIETGLKSEKISRQIVQRTADRATGELIQTVAERPEVNDLIEQQGVGMAQEVAQELQDRTAAADTLLERIIFRILPGSKKDTTPTFQVPIIDEEES